MITGEQKEITLGGLSSAANDYDCADGDLMVAHNMANGGSGLKGIASPETILEIPGSHSGSDFDKLVYVHHTTTKDVYISTNTQDEALYAFTGGDGALTVGVLPEMGGVFADGRYSFSNVGNTLVVDIDGDGLHYLLWKSTNGGEYKYLGQSPPDVGLEFALNEFSGHGTLEEEALYECKPLDTESLVEDKAFQDQVMGFVNKQMKQAKQNTEFTHPFFVRYAYRMYDGNFCNVGAPVYMLPCDGHNPSVQYIYGTSSSNDDVMKFGVISHVFTPQLLARIVGGCSALLEWKDIISGVCLFITPQIVDFSETGDKLTIDTTWKTATDKYVSFDFGEGVIRQLSDGVVTRATVTRTTQPVLGDSVRDIFYYQVYPYARTEGAMKDWVEQTYNFYLLKEYELNDLEELDGDSGWTMVKRQGGIESLETLEQLPDGYESRTLKDASVMHTYNGRLNLANVKVHEKPTFPIGDFSCFSQYDGTASDYDGSTVTVYIEENGQYHTAVATFPAGGQWGEITKMPGYFFYPNANAKYAHVLLTFNTSFSDSNGLVIAGTTFKWTWLKLTRHPYLNGAYHYDPFFGEASFLSSTEGYVKAYDTLRPTEIDSWEKVDAFERHNYIYASEVDNPFIFPATGVNAIGNGSIVTIKTSTKATSEGTAFGTQPLYAFCTDGIWALSVGDNGVYAAKQPVSRETLVNNDPLAALAVDNSILFLSDRGLMNLSGGTTSLLSAALTSRAQTLNAADLPRWETIMKAYGGGETMPAYREADDFLTFIKEKARLAFDYVNYRCIVYRRDLSLAFLYDATSKLWTTMDCAFDNSVEDYPGTLLSERVSGDGSGNLSLAVRKFTADGDGGFIGGGKGFYVTRPMKLGSPDVLKTIRRLVERSVNVNGATKHLALYGSRDFARWTLVAAVNGGAIPRISGTPFRFIVVAGCTEIAHMADVVSRLTLEAVTKYTDRIR